VRRNLCYRERNEAGMASAAAENVPSDIVEVFKWGVYCVSEGSGDRLPML
jgi:hypothetical protein